MKTRKECSETNPRHKMMESEDTLIDIENTYGKEVKDALVKYCKLKKLTPDAVIDDMSEDGNGMTEWDKFDNWAAKKLGLDVMGKFDTDDYDWTGADTAKREQDDWESDHRDEFVESFDAPENEYEMADFIARCLNKQGDIRVDEHGDEADFFFEFNDIPYRVTVE